MSILLSVIGYILIGTFLVGIAARYTRDDDKQETAVLVLVLIAWPIFLIIFLAWLGVLFIRHVVYGERL